MHRRFVVLTASFLCFLLLLANPLQAAAVSPVPQTTLPGFPCYRDLNTLYADASALASAYPNLAARSDIGDSWVKVQTGGAEGYDLFVLRLTNSAIPGSKRHSSWSAAARPRPGAGGTQSALCRKPACRLWLRPKPHLAAGPYRGAHHSLRQSGRPRRRGRADCQRPGGRIRRERA